MREREALEHTHTETGSICLFLMPRFIKLSLSPEQGSKLGCRAPPSPVGASTPTHTHTHASPHSQALPARHDTGPVPRSLDKKRSPPSEHSRLQLQLTSDKCGPRVCGLQGEVAEGEPGSRTPGQC